MPAGHSKPQSTTHPVITVDQPTLSDTDNSETKHLAQPNDWWNEILSKTKHTGERNA